jgi:hypothetical protein
MPADPNAERPAPELIERLQQRRTRLAFFQAAVFVMWQGSFFRLTPQDLQLTRSVEYFRVGAYLIFAILMLIFLARSGGVGWSRRIREILNDEATREHRRQAMTYGFWGAMTAAVALWIAALVRPMGAFWALHWVLTAGLGLAVFGFAFLERRAQADG